jgi:hypothetical protein
MAHGEPSDRSRWGEGAGSLCRVDGVAGGPDKPGHDDNLWSGHDGNLGFGHDDYHDDKMWGERETGWCSTEYFVKEAIA